MNSIPGLDEFAIEHLVALFYSRIRQDAELGPIFDAAINDWDAHERRLCAFWNTTALRQGSYRGNPMALHQPLPADTGHFDRWLQLWRTTTRELLPENAAAHMIGLAERIGHSLMLGMRLKPRARDLGLPLLITRH